MEAWAIARIDLGLTDDEWLDMTPRQVHALRRRQEQKMQREELLVGIIASTSANYSFCRPDPPLEPGAFMLHKLPEPAMTGDEIMRAFSHYPTTVLEPK